MVAAAEPTTSPFRAVFTNPGYSALWTTNLLTSIVNGTSRFVFVWLLTELTDWEAAVALLGIAMGLPALLLSVPAGRLADSKPTRYVGVRAMAAAAVVLAVFGLLVALTDMPVAVAISLAFSAGVPVAIVTPTLQSAVPDLVPHELLLPAVTLQNMGMMTGMIFGAFVGGAAIQLLTSAGALLVLATAAAAAGIVLWRADLPTQSDLARATSSDEAAIWPVAKLVLTTEPLRSLITLTVITGFVMAANILLLPVVAKDVLGADSFAAAMLSVGMGLGMLVTSAVLTRMSARVTRPGRLCLTALSLGLGTGLFLLGWSTDYALTLSFATWWGMMGGVAMNLLRSLTQQSAPPEQMGRVMGIAILAQFGAFPVAAAMLYAAVSIYDARTAMMIFGAITCVLVWAQWLRPPLRNR